MSHRSRKSNAVDRERAHWPEQVVGGKYVKQLQGYVDELRESDPHGNRKLFLDDVFVTYLLAFFNPTLRTLRTLEDFSQSHEAQRHLSMTRICRSTLSDFNRLVDPERLTPILAALRSHVGAERGSSSHSGQLTELLAQTVAVDGTFLPALAETAWAVRSLNQTASTRRRARLIASNHGLDRNRFIPAGVGDKNQPREGADPLTTNLFPTNASKGAVGAGFDRHTAHLQ